MKTLLLSITAFAVVTAPVFAEDQKDEKKQKQNNKAPQTQQRQVNPVPRSYTPKVQQQLANKTQALQNKPNFNKQTYTPKTYTPPVQNPARVVKPPQQDLSANTNTSQNNQKKWNRDNSNRDNWDQNNWNRNRPKTDVVTNQTNTNTDVRNRNWNNDTNKNRDWNHTNRNRNNNNNYNTFTFEQARRNHRHDRHDRSWWRSHYSRISLFAGGYYFWNDGYWYPAYGYDPSYSSYTYDEPIYGYNDLQPGDVISNVQTALQEQGYYRDEVDGLIGPRTRAALSDFQRDRGLPVTAAIDGPTLQALGLY
jgi:hypothetical protein